MSSAACTVMPNQRKYVCSYCSKAFSRSEHRARHERSHTGLKPFECKVCRHAFVRRDLLQRHIRTVHRELLLVRKDARERSNSDASGGGPRSDLVVELLVNSMITVTKRETPELKGERAEVLAQLVGGVLPEAAPCPESVGRMFDAGLACVQKRLHELSPRIHSAVAPQSHVFSSLCAASPLVLAVTALGACAANQRYGGDLWRVSWSSCLRTSAPDRFLSLHVLVLVVLEYKLKANYAEVFSVYQHTCYTVLPEKDAPEKWTAFHYWVTLMRLAETQNEVTPLLFDWFSAQQLHLGRTLGEALETPDEATDTLADAIFCQWMLRRKSRLRDFVEIYARATHGTTIVSESHWLLLETAWFAFLKRLEPSGFYTSCRIAWFRNCLVKDPHAEVDGDAVDDLLLRVVLTVLVALDRETMDPRCVALVADVTLFLLRVFPGGSPSPAASSDGSAGSAAAGAAGAAAAGAGSATLERLFFLLQRRAGAEGVMAYLRGTALFLANLATTDSELRVHLMVAVQGSPSQRDNESPSPMWLLSPGPTCQLVDDRPRRTRSHSGSNIVVLPPLQQGGRPHTSGPEAYAYGHVDLAAPTAAPFASSPTAGTHRAFSVRLPPPSELFQGKD